MKRLSARKFLKYWLPMLLWLTLIFSASSDGQSFQHTSRIIAPLLHWLWPKLAQEQIHNVVVVVRKGAHVSEYAVLAWLFWRLLRVNKSPSGPHWSWMNAGQTLLPVILYAASDEFHQAFVPSREASVRDVLIDTSGAIFALLLLRAVALCRERSSKTSMLEASSATLSGN